MNDKSENISKILQITKGLVRNERSFSRFMLNEDNTMIEDQLPIISPKDKTKKLFEDKLRRCRFFKSSSCLNLANSHKLSKRNIKTTFMNSVLHISKSKNKIFSPRKIFPFNSRLVINDMLIEDENEMENFEYQEDEIYLNKLSYFDKLIQAIKQIITLSDDPNQSSSTTMLTKNIKKQSVLQLRSIQIKFINCKEEKDKYLFELPLQLVPLFFLFQEKNIPLLLLSMFSINEKSENKFSYSTKKMFEMLKRFSYELSRIRQPTGHQKKYHVFKYLWVTINNSFQVEVTMPRIVLTVLKTNTRIVKFIDKQLFIFLLFKDFNKWHMYAIYFLSSFKTFRNIVDTLSSKVETNLAPFQNASLTLSEKRVKGIDKSEKNLSVLLTSEAQDNFLMNLHPPVLEIIKNFPLHKAKLSALNLHPKRFMFNMNQLLFLIKASKFVSVGEFLAKFVDVHYGEVYFDYENFNSIKESHLRSLEKSEKKKVLLENVNIKMHKPYIDILVFENFDFFSETEDFFTNKYKVPVDLLGPLIREENVFDWGDALREVLYFAEDYRCKKDLEKEEKQQNDFTSRVSMRYSSKYSGLGSSSGRFRLCKLKSMSNISVSQFKAQV